jgi:hypothetical protein
MFYLVKINYFNKTNITDYFVKNYISKDTVSVCNKIYRKKIIDTLSIKFLPVSMVGTEDTLFNYTMLFSINSICSVDSCYYYTTTRSDSTTSHYKSGNMQRLVKLLVSVRALQMIKIPQVLHLCYFSIFSNIIYLV